MRTLRTALAQMNATVGDLAGNFAKITAFIEEAIRQDADIIAFPELALTGYPPEDLLLRPEFIDDNLQYLAKLLPYSREITIILGFVDRRDDIYNAAGILHQGELAGVYHKRFLPNYSVFDENRYFQEGVELPVFHYRGINIGVNICEDIWYPGGPTKDQALYGNAEIIINISASPFVMGKVQERNEMLAVRARDNEVILAYVNLIGGQDELIFDGNSLIISEGGKVLANAPAFQEHLLVTDLHPDNVFSRRLHDPRRRKEKRFVPERKSIIHIELPSFEKPPAHPIAEPQILPLPEPMNEVYSALVLGVRDYVRKNGFQQIVLGLSGGIDSALVCAIAVDALGAENVAAISMPSQYTRQSSKDDARILAENLGIAFHEISIRELFDTFQENLTGLFAGREADVTEENLQSRIRGNIVMAYSNKFGALVLTTGNKSEMSTGYCTLYGDMVGALAVIKDVPKMMVFELCRHRNQ
nr:NAD+ synthase [Calditrichia bacterium]